MSAADLLPAIAALLALTAVLVTLQFVVACMDSPRQQEPDTSRGTSPD